MRILVVAAGAVGSVLGARLSEVGQDVELVARGEHAAAIRADGLRLEGFSPGTFRIRASAEVPDAAPVDRLLLTAKTFDLERTADVIGRRFPRLPPTLLPQNGLGVERAVQDRLVSGGVTDPAAALVRAVTFLGATLVRPGVVRQVGAGELVFSDPAHAGPPAAATRAFVELFAPTSVRVRVVPDLDRELWRKAVVNAAINPITALNGVPNGRLLDEPLRSAATQLLREAQRAAALAGYVFDDPEADAELERVLRATAENRSSMLQDWERGRPTEVEAISGELLRVADRSGVDLPETRRVVDRLRARAAGRTQSS